MIESVPETSLTRIHARAPYNAAEQQFSVILQERLQELLEGKRNDLVLLRRYPRDPERLGVMMTPPDVVRHELRLRIVEEMTWRAVAFLCAGENGGPVSQDLDADGNVFERQIFATRFPHIVMARTDRFSPEGSEPESVTWCLQRVQNQRQQTQLNRLLDAANLGLEVMKLIRP